MHTISAMAKSASLPRRTVQYWHDQGVLEPLSRSPLVYSDEELRLVRVIAPFARWTPSISAIRWLAHNIRLALASDSSVPANVLRAFEDGRAGRPAYFIVAPEINQDEEIDWTWTDGAHDHWSIGASVSRMLQGRPELSPTVIDLGFALDIRLSAGRLFSE